MYIEKGLIRYSSHGEIQCDHMLKSTFFNAGNVTYPLCTFLFSRSSSPLLISCLLSSLYFSVTQLSVDVLKRTGLIWPFCNSAQCLKTIQRTQKKETQCETCLTLRHCHLFSSSWPPRGDAVFVGTLSGQGSPQGSPEVETDIIDLTSGQLPQRSPEGR